MAGVGQQQQQEEWRQNHLSAAATNQQFPDSFHQSNIQRTDRNLCVRVLECVRCPVREKGDREKCGPASKRRGVASVHVWEVWR